MDMQGAHDKAQKHTEALRQRVAGHKQRAGDSRRALCQAQRTIRAFEVAASRNDGEQELGCSWVFLQ